MRILLVHSFYGTSAPSGENAVFEAESAMLRRHGHEVVEFTRHSDTIRRQGAWGLLHGALSTPWNPCVVHEMKKLIERERPQVMHVHNTFPLISPAVFRAARGTGTATVLTLHNYRLFCAKAIPLRQGKPCVECLDRRSVVPALRYGCYRDSRLATLPLALSIALHRRLSTWQREVDAFIALTRFQRDTMVAAGLPADRLHIKPHFYPDPPAPLPWQERNSVVVYLGRLSPEKGVRVLLDAWRYWGASAPRLLLIGDGPERPNLERMVQEELASGKVEFLGQLPYPHVQQLLACARLLVLPSLSFEGFPMVIREAFALGVPVAGSRLGAIASIVEEGRTGVLFKPGDSVDLFRAVQALWSEGSLLQELGRTARTVFEDEYTEEKNHQRLLAIYHHAVETRRARGR